MLASGVALPVSVAASAAVFGSVEAGREAAARVPVASPATAATATGLGVGIGKGLLRQLSRMTMRSCRAFSTVPSTFLQRDGLLRQLGGGLDGDINRHDIVLAATSTPWPA